MRGMVGVSRLCNTHEVRLTLTPYPTCPAKVLKAGFRAIPEYVCNAQGNGASGGVGGARRFCAQPDYIPICASCTSSTVLGLSQVIRKNPQNQGIKLRCADALISRSQRNHRNAQSQAF